MSHNILISLLFVQAKGKGKGKGKRKVPPQDESENGLFDALGSLHLDQDECLVALKRAPLAHIIVPAYCFGHYCCSMGPMGLKGPMGPMGPMRPKGPKGTKGPMEQQ